MTLNIIYTILRLIFLIAITSYISLSIANNTVTAWSSWEKWLLGIVYVLYFIQFGIELVGSYFGKYPSIGIPYICFYAVMCIGEIYLDIGMALRKIKALKKDKTN